MPLILKRASASRPSGELCDGDYDVPSFRCCTPLGSSSAALIVVIGAGAAAEVNPWWVALEALVVWVCLQLGYIPGVIIATYAASRKFGDRQQIGHDAIGDFWPP
jgi:hypothetical protein